MKSILALCMFFILFISCDNNNAVTIKGYVLNSKGKKIKVQENSAFSYLPKQIAENDLAADGSFSVKVSISKPCQLEITSDDYSICPLFVVPGKEYTVNYDFKKLAKPRLGEKDEVNNFVQDMLLEIENTNCSSTDANEVISCLDNNKRNAQNELKQRIKKLNYQEYCFLQQKIEDSYNLKIFNLASIHRIKADDPYYNYLKGYKLEQDSVLDPQHSKLVSFIIESRFISQTGKSPYLNTHDYYNYISGCFTNKETAVFYKGYYLFNELLNWYDIDLDYADSLFTDFKINCKDECLVKPVMEKYDLLKSEQIHDGRSAFNRKEN